MKRLFPLSLLAFTASLHAQSAARPVLQHSTTKELLDTLKSGSKTVEISAAGTLEFKSGFTLTGGSYLKTSLALDNVENTALSTWAGTTNITTLGTITTGTWNGSVIGAGYGGTGQTNLQDAINALLAASGALSQGDLFYHNGANVVRLAAGTSGQYLQTQGAGANPQWATVSTGLTIDTTAISGGTVGRVLYHKTGNVVGELETSAGGNGSDDNGKLATYNASGNLTASQFNVQDGITSANYGPAALTFDDGAGNSTTVFVTLSGSNTVTLAANTGTILTTGALGANVATWLATPSKANLNAAVSDDDPAYLSGNAFTGANSITLSALGTTPTAGASLINSTAATSGNQQYSPSLVLQGNVWETTGGTSKSLTSHWFMAPYQTTAPNGYSTLKSYVNGAAVTNGTYEFGAYGDLWIGNPSGAPGGNAAPGVYLGTRVANAPTAMMSSADGIRMSKNHGLRWNNGFNAQGADDVAVFWLATHQLYVGNGTNACTWLVMNTVSSATSYEAAGVWWSSNVAYFGTQKGSGGGSARDVSLVRDSTVKFTANANTNDHEQPAKMKVYAVGSLPAAGTVGAYAVAAVSDALVPVVGSTVAGGGSAKALVCSNGTLWIVIATL